MKFIRYEIQPTRTKRGTQWFVSFVAANGETMQHSETFTRRGDAVRAAKRVKAASAKARIVILDSHGLLVSEVT